MNSKRLSLQGRMGKETDFCSVLEVEQKKQIENARKTKTKSLTGSPQQKGSMFRNLMPRSSVYNQSIQLKVSHSQDLCRTKKLSKEHLLNQGMEISTEIPLNTEGLDGTIASFKENCRKRASLNAANASNVKLFRDMEARQNFFQSRFYETRIISKSRASFQENKYKLSDFTINIEKLNADEPKFKIFSSQEASKSNPNFVLPSLKPKISGKSDSKETVHLGRYMKYIDKACDFTLEETLKLKDKLSRSYDNLRK
jgi:hypothetical protein